MKSYSFKGFEAAFRLLLCLLFVTSLREEAYSAMAFTSRQNSFNSQGNFKILVYDETSGFTHISRDAARTMFRSLGEEMGFDVDYDRDGSAFNSLENLQNYTIVVFSNTSGNEILNQAQKENFEAYIKAGGSFLGIHAATDTYRSGWNWYRDLVGGTVRENPNHTEQNFPGTMDVLETTHPSVQNIPNPWSRNEEWYYWKDGGGYLYPHNINLLQVRATGEEEYDEARPISWYKEYDGGRSFYTAMGHSNGTYSEDAFIAHIAGAIEWLASEDSSPPSEYIAPSFDEIEAPEPIGANAGIQTISITGINPGSGSPENVVVSATSSNPTLIPNPEVSYNSEEKTATVSYKPEQGQHGSSVITITIDNGELENNEAMQTFTVVVNPEPVVLEVTEISGQSFQSGQTPSPIPFQVNYSEGSYENLEITASSNNQEVIPNENIKIEGEEGNYEIHLNPVNEGTGSVEITLTVSDGETLIEEKFNVEILSITPVSEEVAGILQIYPNPAKGALFIKAPDGTYNVVIYNLKGQIVFESKALFLGSNYNKVMLPEMAKGAYVLKLASNFTLATKLILIK